MTTIPAPAIVLPGEEWPDADFDLPEGEPIHASDAESDKDDNEEDWDLEMDLGKTGGAKLNPALASTSAVSAQPSSTVPQMFTIRPPLTPASEDDEDDDEGVSTIKVAALPKPAQTAPPATIEEDIEDGLALPSDLTQLSLRPLSLNHRSSKSSLEWGDKDQTSSSQSSDAYSSLGFNDTSPSSNYTSASLPETETDEDEDDLDGLVIPTALFDSGRGASKLAKLLEAKKKTTFTDDRVKIASPDPEDDFEIGLVLDDDSELSPSRLLQNAQKPKRPVPSPMLRSKSVPPRTISAAIRPPSRTKVDRAKSPNNPPVSSVTQLRRLNSPSSPPRPGPAARSQTYSQALTATPSSSSFLTPKPGSLRVQKSHSGLKPPSPPATRKLTRKASLPSLSDASQNQASGSASGSSAAPVARYETPTASSRAKVHTNSTSRIHGLDYNVPPTRPSTPSSNPVALRLTMPTSSSRLKARPAISSVFPTSATATNAPPLPRSASPLPPRPPSSSSSKSRHVSTQSLPLPPAVKVLKRPKRTRTYGDGTELDGFEDLPLDREKEGRYRVQPKGYGNRVPGASYSSKVAETIPAGKGTLRRTAKKRDLSSGSAELASIAPPTKTLRRTSRRDSQSSLKPSEAEINVKKKKSPSSPSQTRRKPTLIRNLGGSNAPKVVGEMKWNPQTLRWEGNDHVLRDFDAAVGTSTRPALITHLTGSSIGSPGGSFASGARVVGNMIFDPSRMCWISTLPPEEDEPDVFAELADDEDEDDWEAKGGTIRANQQGGAAQTGNPSRTEPPSPARSHTRSISESESDRGSRASMVCNVDDDFLEKCRAAEERHRSEMRGWIPTVRSDPFAPADRTYLYEIRALATRQY
ncbi:hypothetical protein K474DRAFT_298187 [Panus rudis PR-1116 ss-1]|nr:hypothetical protein K474DRAFT_298187 [Panus rudis PR-1116 ss-1]